MKPMMVRSIALMLIVGGGLLLLSSNREALGQDDKELLVVPDKADGKAALVPKLIQGVDVEYCLNCHKLTSAEKSNPDVRKATRDFIVYDEIRAWNAHDLHRRAFTNIVADPKGGPGGTENLAEKMQRIMRRTRGANYLVHKAGECLACHAVDAAVDPVAGKADPIPSTLVNDPMNPRFDTRFGVSCEACHGIVKEGWGEAHATPGRWRPMLPADKLAKGQIDLRHPEVRGEKCASCHIGNKAEGKFVTHEMFAAGHPPLPPLEMATFSSEQPAHFYHSRENKFFKEEAAKDKDSVYKRFHYREGESGETRMMAYGTVIGLRSVLKLLESEAKELETKGGLLDFAQFDCAACHHDLKYPGDRQNRKGGISGRPLMKVNTELLDIVLAHAATKAASKAKIDEMRTQLATVKAAFERRPFGDPSEIAKLAGPAIKACDDLLKDLEPIVYDVKALEELQALILKRLRPSEGPLDYEAAQTLTWALLFIRSELAAMNGDKKAPDDLASRLEKAIPTAVRPKNATDPQESVEKRLRDRLKRQYDFESMPFFKVFSVSDGK